MICLYVQHIKPQDDWLKYLLIAMGTARDTRFKRNRKAICLFPDEYEQLEREAREHFDVSPDDAVALYYFDTEIQLINNNTAVRTPRD